MKNKVIELLKKKKISGFLITNIINVRYLSNFTGSNGQILITKNNLYFFTDFRYLEQSKKEVSKDFQIIIYKKFISELKNILKKEKVKSIGIEAENINLKQYKEFTKKIDFVKIKPIENFLLSLRKVKTEEEIKKIKKAIEISERALKNCAYYIEAKGLGITEEKFARKLHFEMLKLGAEDISFPIIVLSDKNSSIVHGKPSNTPLKRNILIDFGAKFNGYCADKTVSIILNTKEEELKKIFNIVKDAKNFAIEKIKIGKKAKDIDKIAREYIDKKGYGKYFGHSLGHGIGLEVHENPVIAPNSKEIIEEGNVFTVEPGIYIPDFGGVRLEDVVYVSNKGIELLTTPAEKFNLWL